jgi:molybdate-binding protein
MTTIFMVYPPLSVPQAQRLVQFVKRRQGLMVPSGNPKGIRTIADRDLDLGTGPQVVAR